MASNEKDDDANVTDPRDSDVLCGRGGAALRHPGNQTYRRLVNLNKGLYITCLKTEKLKISRSIVAAIREQNGRFLERDAKKGSWFDIGDKKAVEKTSQALREGQPKLRQKMVEMGQIPQDGSIAMEHRFGNGVYNPRGNPSGMQVNTGYNLYNMNQPQLNPNASQAEMPPPPARALSNEPMNPDALISRLSLSNSIPSWTPSVAQSVASNNSHMRLSNIPPNSIPSWTPSVTSLMTDDNAAKLSVLPPNSIPSWTPSVTSVDMSLNRARMVQSGRGGNFMNSSMLSLMSQFSGAGNNESAYGMEIDLGGSQHGNTRSGNHPGNPANNGLQHPPPPPSESISPIAIGPGASPLDRRRVFAKMKYNRPGSSMRVASTHSRSDGMPDVQMVESNISLMSDFSNHASNHARSNNSYGGGPGPKDKDLMPSFSDHSIGVGSRRSLMSGLSRISDTSGINSVFSDMSKKFSNTSTRSIAMSEFSDIQEAFNEDFDGFNFEVVTASKPTA